MKAHDEVSLLMSKSLVLMLVDAIEEGFGSGSFNEYIGACSY
jgi:hypothetical protein